MAAKKKRLSPAIISNARATLIALAELRDYRPTNPAYSIEALCAREARLSRAEEAELTCKQAYEVAREEAAAEARAFVGDMVGSKTQVVAQFGSDSPVVHTVGLKQKSERKRPVRRTPEV